mmetsp:Transcript_8326/g.12823  ORF Transcript_8326/g.12823 Transcript_8326/m.12823 type:complete len:350 (+) Transcript_8326:152-1201(+)
MVKVIAIMGATGKQGGATVRAFNALKESGNSEYKLRAITRDPSSKKAKAIESLVDEVVKADAKDRDSMVKAFRGCYGVFVVSNFWEDMNVHSEMEALRCCKEALKQNGYINHIVLSSFEDSRVAINSAANKDTWKPLEGQEKTGMYVDHIDGKGEVQTEFEKEGLYVTSLYTSFYYENFIDFGMGPSRQSDRDPYAITFPIDDVKLPMVAVSDIGKAVCAIFQEGSSLIGKTVGIMSENLSGQEIADTFTKVCGEEVVFNNVPWHVYASFGFPGADGLANMFRYEVEHIEAFTKPRVVSNNIKKLMGGLTSFESWVIENKGAFQLEPKNIEQPVEAKPEPAEANCCTVL